MYINIIYSTFFTCIKLRKTDENNNIRFPNICVPNIKALSQYQIDGFT